MPVEMLGYVEFPKIEKTPYAITLNQYGFLWLELQGELEPEEPEPPADAGFGLLHTADWKTVLAAQRESGWSRSGCPHSVQTALVWRQVTADHCDRVRTGATWATCAGAG